ncbi:MAG: hypothetical protein CM15mP59_2970 [Flavobacteriaceae bacterium]|nr:MAG: hypothetical protein CM15mP59_2970 [Flavobacteriaceae bacterium]
MVYGSFCWEKVFDNDGKLIGISVSKTNNDPKDLDKNDHEVDAISGAQSQVMVFQT